MSTFSTSNNNQSNDGASDTVQVSSNAMEAIHNTLNAVDDIRLKITDQEYKKIVEKLQMVYMKRKRHYKIQYQVSQCHVEKVFQEEDEIAVLVTSESNHFAIVESVNTSGESITTYASMLLLGLRKGHIPDYIIRDVQKQLASHMFYCISDKHSGCVSGDIAPWAGTKMDGSDVTTKIMIVNCNEYQL